MMIVLVALLGLVVALGLAFWPWPERTSASRDTGRPLPCAAAPLPESLEGVLTRQLMTGEISRPQYVRAVERIAARDERRHPMSVPPDYRP